MVIFILLPVRLFSDKFQHFLKNSLDFAISTSLSSKSLKFNIDDERSNESIKDLVYRTFLSIKIPYENLQIMMKCKEIFVRVLKIAKIRKDTKIIL